MGPGPDDDNTNNNSSNDNHGEHIHKDNTINGHKENKGNDNMSLS